MIPSSMDLAGRVDAVAEGRDGRLFLHRGDGFDAETAFAKPFTDLARLELLWAAPIERRLRLCREIGAKLVFLIAPEAHGVHADALPAPLAYATPSVGDRFRALAEGMGATVVWPRDALAAARGPVEVFRPDDSHWSAFGAYAAYAALMDVLPPALARGRVGREAVSFAWSEAMGDLGWTEAEARRRPCLQPVFDAPRARTVLDRRNERRHALKITEIDDPGLPTALVFRDSFGTELAPFLMESFRRTVLVGSGERAYVEMIVDEAPDVVIVERSERALLTGVIDWGPETWREAFPADHNGEAHEAELAARRLLHEGDLEAARREGDTALSHGSMVERRILAGRIRLAAGDPSGAAELLESALHNAPDRWTTLLHLGCARMATGEMTVARDLFARACALAPWRPGGFEHFGYASLQAGDAASAVPALRAAVRLGPEVAGAHLWLTEALSRLGDGEGAKAALSAGLRQCPDDPLLQARAAATQASPGRPPH